VNRRESPNPLAALACVVLLFTAGAAKAQLVAPTPVAISPAGEICHDFPDVVVTSPGSAAAAVWMGYDFTADEDEIYTATLSGTTWAAAVATGIEGDLFQPRLGDDGTGTVRIVWAEQVGANWDLYERPFSSGTITRLTTDEGSDTNPATCSDPSNGRFFLVWQAFRSGRWAIFLKVYESASWGATKVVSQPDANEWFPKAAIDSTGKLWIAWDSYRNGDYDIYLRSYDPGAGTFGSEIQVTANQKYEANVSIACDSDDRVWLTWETGAENWGKDAGRLVNEGRLTMPEGKKFLNSRRIAVGVYDGSVKTTSGAISALYSTFNDTYDPIVAVDSRDRPWVFHARRVQYGGTTTKQYWSAWEYSMSRYDLTAWDTAVVVPNSWARIERKMLATPYDADRLLCLWHVDGRVYSASDYRLMRHGPPDGKKIIAAIVDVPTETDADPSLTTPTPDTPAALTHPAEAADVAAVRAYTPTIDGKVYQIVRGDTHRHNDISWDGTGDSSLDDLYRYGYDAAALDFIMPSDHHSQLHASSIYPNWNFYPWRRSQKLVDIYYSPGTLVPFHGYERSRPYPNGHRNVILPGRTARGDAIVRSTSATPLGDDLGILWDAVRTLGGIVIAHTPGDEMGTSWDYDIDLDIEPVVEIYQGCRYSFENYQTTPEFWPNIDQRSNPTGNEEIHPDGFYFANLAQRAPSGDFRNKLGIISSSDHGSTHLSYACIYVEEATRQGIIDAIKARHTYGAMDNIIMDVRCGTAMMGDDMVVSDAPTIEIHIAAPKTINQVVVIRDNAIIYTYDPSSDPDPTVFDHDFTDLSITPGYHYYYVRARQDDGTGNDGTLAWSSPLWVRHVAASVRNWRVF
jgi:hypothetical protein